MTKRCGLATVLLTQIERSYIMKEQLLLNETLYSVANGYIGMRANFEEGYPEGYDSIRGTYLNGFYDIVDIEYSEKCYGFPETAQKIVNIMDAQTIYLTFGDERFSFFEGEVLDSNIGLDIDKGLAYRRVHWKSPDETEVILTFTRMTSFEQLELSLIHIDIESVNYEGDVYIESILDGNVENYTNPNDPRVASGHPKLLSTTNCYDNGDMMQLISETKRSYKEVCCSVAHDIPMSIDAIDDKFIGKAEIELSIGDKKGFTKYIVFTDSIRHKGCQQKGIEVLTSALERDVNQWFESQEEYLNKFWKYSRISIPSKPIVEQSLNYSIYQLLASAGKDTHSNIAAKGLSGEGYEGHYFWDTEVYMLPFFTLTNPEIAKNLLLFRHETIEDSKNRAIEMGHLKGAKIPWRTISGTECSGFFPAGSAQYHINGDVAFSYIQYYLYHNDHKFMKDYGYRVLVETARIWLDMGHYNDDGVFMIHEVTGPDEYTACVNNNYYTNVMAKYHLYWTCKIGETLNEVYTDFGDTKDKYKVTNEEIEAMGKASEAMCLPYDEKLGIYLQDDSFKDKPTWDFEQTPKDNYPLLLHYHPLTIYRHKVCKQADALLAMVLLDDVSTDVLEKSYDYYEPLTTHDSSLSPCVFSMAASRIQRSELAYKFFMDTLRLDLDNLHHNTKDGLHIANAGGAYMTVVYGFAGLRIKEDGLHLNPCVPKELGEVTFGLNYRDQLVEISIGTKLIIKCENTLKVVVNHEEYQVEQRLEVDLVE